MPPLTWFDAHLDLAYLAENGRDMLAPLETCGGPDQPASASFPSLAEGRVRRCLATVFTEADGKPIEPQSYPAGDVDAAHAAGLRQVEWYARWRAAGAGPRMDLLIECADPVRTPDELGWWKQQGVVAIGMTWARAGRYAGGNGTTAGLTDLGRELAREMDRLGIVHDVSHLSDRAFDDLLLATDRLVIASHSNCRELLGGGGVGENQRHLRDDQIRDIVGRGGVIGLNLFSAFLSPATRESGRASIDDCVRHIGHVCDIAGSLRHVGLGSDMDGGFSAARLPRGIDRPRDLTRLAEALAQRGWSDAEVAGFAHGNWERVFGRR